MKEFILGGVVALLFFIQCIWMDFIIYMIIGVVSIISLVILTGYVLLEIKQVHSKCIKKHLTDSKRILINKIR